VAVARARFAQLIGGAMATIPVRARGLLTEVGELFVVALEGLRRSWDIRSW
jgi:phospholipid/cholesterol/gamma-HCH transport system permease protein